MPNSAIELAYFFDAGPNNYTVYYTEFSAFCNISSPSVSLLFPKKVFLLALCSSSTWLAFMGIKGMSLPSSSSSVSVVLRLIQEHRSSDAKKAEATLAPTHPASRSSFRHPKVVQLPAERSSLMDFDSTKGSRRWHSPQLGRGLLDAFIYTCLKQFQNRRRMDEKKCRWDWEHPTQPNPNRIMRSNTDLDAEFRKGYFKSLCRKGRRDEYPALL